MTDHPFPKHSSPVPHCCLWLTFFTVQCQHSLVNGCSKSSGVKNRICLLVQLNGFLITTAILALSAANTRLMRRKTMWTLVLYVYHINIFILLMLVEVTHGGVFHLIMWPSTEHWASLEHWPSMEHWPQPTEAQLICRLVHDWLAVAASFLLDKGAILTSTLLTGLSAQAWEVAVLLIFASCIGPNDTGWPWCVVGQT